jgi:TRAP transporter TAXI family solute receptor
MYGNKITYILALVLMLSPGFCSAIELPKNPFAKEVPDPQQSVKQASADVITPQSAPTVATKPAALQNTAVTVDKTIPKKNAIRIKNINIATTSSSGSIGDAICSLINYNQDKIGFKCSIKKLSGSLKNISALKNGDVDFAIVPANIVYDQLLKASESTNVDNATNKFSFVLSLYAAKLNALVKYDSNIKSINDIKGKVIDVTNADSSANYMLQAISKIGNWDSSSLNAVEYIRNKDKPNALCSGQIDISLNYVGTPNAHINDMTKSCKVRIISMEDDLVSQLSNSNDFIGKDTISGGTYLGNPMDVNTFSSPLILLTNKDTDTLIVYNLTKLLIQNMSMLSKIHPAFKAHPLSNFADNKNLIPYHEGSEKLFREKELLAK